MPFRKTRWTQVLNDLLKLLVANLAEVMLLQTLQADAA